MTSTSRRSFLSASFAGSYSLSIQWENFSGRSGQPRLWSYSVPSVPSVQRDRQRWQRSSRDLVALGVPFPWCPSVMGGTPRDRARGRAVLVPRFRARKPRRFGPREPRGSRRPPHGNCVSFGYGEGSAPRWSELHIFLSLITAFALRRVLG